MGEASPLILPEMGEASPLILFEDKVYEAYSKIRHPNTWYTPTSEMRTFMRPGPHPDRILGGH